MKKYKFSETFLPSIALMILMLVACTDTSTSSSSSSSSDSVTAKIPSVASPTKTNPVPVDTVISPVAKPEEKPDPVMGKWKLLMGSYTWTVRLTPRPKLNGEYAGTGTRDVRDEDGKIVRMEIGAALTKGKFKAWLGPGFIIGEGRFSQTGVIEGSCIKMNGEDGGRFKAERLFGNKE